MANSSDSHRGRRRDEIAAPQPQAAATQPSAGSSRSFQMALFTGLLGALFAWAYWPTLDEIVGHWNSNPDYTHGYLVVPLALLFLWMRREQAPFAGSSPAWSGLVLVALAAVARIVSARLYLPEVDGWSIPLWIGGVCWLCFGWRVFRWAAPSIAFLWFMVPLPARVETLLSGPLQSIATQMSTWTLQCLGQPALAEGTTILLEQPPALEVERACSGLRLFYGIVALSVGYIMLVRAPRWKALALVVSVGPIALLANTARIVTTGLLQQWVSGEAAHKFSHDLAGILMVVVAVPMFGAVSVVLSRFESSLQRSRSRTMLAVAGCMVVFALLVPAAYGWHSFQQSRNVKTLLDRATALEAEQKWDVAAGYLDRYLRLRPDDADVRQRLAQTFDKATVGTDFRGRALDLYAEAWAVMPSNTDLGKRHAELALELRRYSAAVESSDKLLALTANDPSVAGLHALAARIKALGMIGRFTGEEQVGEQDDWQAIVTALQQAIVLNPSDAELAVRLAEIHRKRLTAPAEPERIKIADAVLDKLVDSNPDFPAAYLARYRFHMRYRPENADREYDTRANADLDRALEIGKKNAAKEDLDVLMTAGERAFHRNDLAESERHYKRATELSPLDYRGWLRLGETEFSAGTRESQERAVETWKQGLKSVGRKEIYLIVPLTGALIDLNRIAEAEAELRPLEDVLPRLAEPAKSALLFGVTLLKARAKAVSQKHGEAVAMLRQLLNTEVGYEVSLQLKPQYAAVWRALGEYYTVLQSPDQAAHAYEQAGRLDETTPEWQWKAAKACESAGRFADAVTFLETAARQSPSNGVIWLSLARVSLIRQIELPPSSRDWQTYRRAVERASQLGADPSFMAILQADYAMAEGRPQEGITLLQQALAKQPDSADLWRSMAVVRHKAGPENEMERALKEYERCSKDPKSVALLRAGFLAGDGKPDAARTVLAAAVGSLPDDQKYAVQFEIAQLDLQLGRRDEGRRQLVELSKLRPADLELLELQARLALESNDWTGLEETEQTLRKIEGEEGSIWRDFRARRLLAQSTDVEDNRFREASRLVTELDRLRPSWHRTAALRGQISRREGRVSDAIESYELAVRLGNKSISLAEELIDLLTEQRRFAEADRHLNRVRDAVARSSRLSSVAIPIYVRRGESEEALRLAEDWIRREPNDPASYMRLGRTLLITSGDGKTAAGKKSLNEAEAAFNRAVELGATDVRTWVALFHFHLRYRQNERAALDMLGRLAEQLNILPARKAFVLAQLYESVGRRSLAARYYHESVKLAPEAARAQVCERAAQFFVTDDPKLAEDLSRRALALAPGSLEARRALVLALAEQGGETKLTEATEVFANLEASGRQTPADRRLHAVLLIRRGRPEDRRQAIEILENLVQIPQQALPRDRLQLSNLFEAENRVQPAFEQFWAVAREENATPSQLAAFVEFLQRNSLEQPQFVSRAESILERLEAEPSSAVTALRLRIRAAKESSKEEPGQSAAVRSTLDKFVQGRLKNVADEAVRKDVFTGLLLLLVRESLGDQALRICRESPLDATTSAACLANALAVSRESIELTAAAEPLFTNALRAKPDDPDLNFAMGNLRFTNGRRDEAIAHYRKVIAAQPQHKHATNNLALALADDPAGIDEALTTIVRAIEKTGRDAGLLDTQAVVLLRQKKAPEARQILEEAMLSRDSEPLYLLHLAAAYRREGDTDKARRTFERAVDLNAPQNAITPGDREFLKELQRDFAAPASAN